MKWKPIDAKALKSRKPLLGWFANKHIEGVYRSEGEWFFLTDGEGPLDKGPKYYMPLPEPPKEGE